MIELDYALLKVMWLGCEIEDLDFPANKRRGKEELIDIRNLPQNAWTPWSFQTHLCHRLSFNFFKL